MSLCAAHRYNYRINQLSLERERERESWAKENTLDRFPKKKKLTEKEMNIYENKTLQ